jgi:hypothetical protein
MTEKKLLSRLLLTEWIASFIGRARQGDLHDNNHEARSAAWAHWVLKNFAEFKGLGSREYIGLILPGTFHDPRGTMPKVVPHLEIQQGRLEKGDRFFPDRLSQAGNGLLFPWWVFSEVAALKRGVFPKDSGDPTDFIRMIEVHRIGLINSVLDSTRTLQKKWNEIEASMFADPEEMLPLITGNFSENEVSLFLPEAKIMKIEIRFDEKLRESQGLWASRRVGIWEIKGVMGKNKFTLGVITPRMTASSLFNDPLFAPEKESTAALLVRGLLLRRLITKKLGLPTKAGLSAPAPLAPRFLRAVVAQPGSKLPQASVRAAVHFIQTYSTSYLAWEAIQEWAGKTYMLTTGEQAFKAAFDRSKIMIKRAEEPDRSDIDTILPICWDEKSRVVRATFTLPNEDERTANERDKRPHAT